MGALLEQEIFSCMTENLRLAAGHARDLALKPKQGPTYWSFREEMLMVEGCCRQASAWREDSRWLNIGMVIAEALDRTGKWLRGTKSKDKLGRTFGPREWFLKMAETLDGISMVIDQTRDARTGIRGMILPNTPSIARTQGRPMQVILPHPAPRASGLIMP